MLGRAGPGDRSPQPPAGQKRRERPTPFPSAGQGLARQKGPEGEAATTVGWGSPCPLPSGSVPLRASGEDS